MNKVYEEKIVKIIDQADLFLGQEKYDKALLEAYRAAYFIYTDPDCIQYDSAAGPSDSSSSSTLSSSSQSTDSNESNDSDEATNASASSEVGYYNPLLVNYEALADATEFIAKSHFMMESYQAARKYFLAHFFFLAYVALQDYFLDDQAGHASKNDDGEVAEVMEAFLELYARGYSHMVQLYAITGAILVEGKNLDLDGFLSMGEKALTDIGLADLRGYIFPGDLEESAFDYYEYGILEAAKTGIYDVIMQMIQADPNMMKVFQLDQIGGKPLS